ncbi:MAG: arginine--tRNA ligase [Deltaproteobacteria bacterium]|nr:arginine--tRNA ligase [Deltaproteobacteria bacterium]
MNKYQKEILKILPPQWEKKKIEWHDFLEKPKDLSQGDYAIACFRLAKDFKKPPQKLAQEIGKQLKTTKLIPRIHVIGAYINFFIESTTLTQEVLEAALSQKEKYGSSSFGKGKTIVIDYSAPNIAKPFHMGHLRSTIIGQSLYNIYTFLGFRTIGINHLGDWGTQYGKLIYAFQMWGNEKEYKQKGIPYLHELYVRFHKEAKGNESLEEEARKVFKKLEEGDKEIQKIWKIFKEESLKEFEKTYKRLSISFDFTLGESFYTDKIEAALKKIKDSKLSQKSEGALIVPLEKYSLSPCLLRKNDGTTLYATRDIATALYRYEKHHFTTMIYVVGQDQTLHFKQVFKVLELMGLQWAENCIHLPFGLVSFKEGKMSTREGKVILLKEVLDKARDLALKNIEAKNEKLKNKEEVAEKIGIGAIIFGDLSQKMMRNISFDWDEILSFEGETGPYLQYTYARARSILRKSKEKPSIKNTELLKEELELLLIKLLFQFSETLEAVLRFNEPSILANYLLDVTKTFNRFYLHHKVVTEEAELQKARLALVESTCHVLKNGLGLLNIPAPEEM